MNKTLTMERRASLEWAIKAAVTCGYTSDADVLRGLLADILAAQQPEPRAEVTEEVVQWGRVIEIGDRHGMQWAGKTGWRFENDDSVHAFANDIARFALNSRAGECQ